MKPKSWLQGAEAGSLLDFTIKHFAACWERPSNDGIICLVYDVSFLYPEQYEIFFFVCDVEIINLEKYPYSWGVCELAVRQTVLLSFVFWCHCPVFCDRKRKGNRVYSEPMYWGCG